MAGESRAAADSVEDLGDLGSLAAVGPPPREDNRERIRDPERERRRDAERQQLVDMLSRAAYQFDFFQVMRRLECAYRDQPRMGESARPSDDPIRLGQEPSLAFAPASLSRMRAGREGFPSWLLVNFFGVFGPNGPMPLHITEYARDRLRNSDDPTMVRFFDVFHHRMLLFFYRAWAIGEPTVNLDRPENNRFLTYVGSLAGLALRSFRNRDEMPDRAKLFYVGHLAGLTRNPDGLEWMIADFLQMPARIEPFKGCWLDLPVDNRWALGRAPRGILGSSAVLGAHIWTRQHKFRVTLGPLNRAQFQRMLPGGTGIPELVALVRNYLGDELRWDLRLFLEEKTEARFTLGGSRVGWTTWLGKTSEGKREDLILDPQGDLENARAAG